VPTTETALGATTRTAPDAGEEEARVFAEAAVGVISTKANPMATNLIFI
jgi:hypothetical protein